MAGQNNFVKISTGIRTIKSDVGSVRISLFNDQVAFSISPATGKDEMGNIRYDGRPTTAPNVRFSPGVAAGIAQLLTAHIIPAAEQNATKRWDVFACKRKNYEAYLAFETREGKIMMTGTEVNNDIRKQASYAFPVTQVKDESGKDVPIQGEALAMAELLREIGGNNDGVVHMKAYTQAVKDNFGQRNNMQSPTSSFGNVQPAQPMNSWHP